MEIISRPLTRREINLLLIAGILGLAFIFWILIYSPSLDKISALKLDKADLERVTSRLEEKVANRAAIQAQWNRLQQEQEQWATLVPSPKDLPQVIGALESLINGFSLQIVNFEGRELSQAQSSQQESDDAGGSLNYIVAPYVLEVAGGEAVLDQLLEELEAFPHLLMIERTVWGRGSNNLSLTVHFSLILSPDR